MTDLPSPPAAYLQFTERNPEIAKAWEQVAMAGKDGPLDPATVRLVKLGVAIGAMREGSVHASVRKALAQGIEPEALDQVVAIAAGTIGFPAAVAVSTWVNDITDLGDEAP
jgi:alkylhydroperoxidase/carboxymuconolactone decarboxylase family protein YurZ